MLSKIRTKRKKASGKPAATVHRLLKVLNIPATYGHIDKTLKEHPDYPSLLSLAESLKEWGVETEGVKGEIGDISAVDFPSIVHLGGNQHNQMDQDFAVLENMTDNRVSILYPIEGRKTLNLDEFAKIWSGILLRTAPGKQTRELYYKEHRKTERLDRFRKYFAVFGFPTLLMLAFYFGLARVGFWNTLIPLTLSKVIGFAVCVVMTIAGMGSGGLLRSLCPLGKIVNCHRVLRSPAGKLFGVSMAEWGMLYFGGGLLSLLGSFFFGQFQNDLFLLALVGLLVLPYTLFSVIYQAFFVRSWCWMCLVIMGLFWLEFYLLYDIIATGFERAFVSVVFPMSLLIGFGAATIGWVSLKHVIEAAKKADELERRATRVRRQPEYIRFQLGKAEKADMGNMPFEVEIGPPQANLTITAVVNPLCGHCWRAFNQLDQLIGIAAGNLKGAVRFLVTPNKEEETPTKTEEFLDREVSLRILSLAQNGNRELVHKALSDWFAPGASFSKGGYKRWQDKYRLGDSSTIQKAARILDLHRDWATLNKIAGTPTLFFNGRRIPPGMQLDDLKIFLIRQFES